MASKVIAGTGVLAVVALGGLVALPYIVGAQAEAQLDAALQEISSPYMAWRKVSYDKGLYRAEATTEVVIRTSTDSISIPLRHTIRHAPLAGAGAAHITTELQIPQAIEADVATIFQGNAPLSFNTTVGFSGDTYTDYGSPAFTVEKEGMTLTSDGLSGTIAVDGDRVVLNGSLPELRGTGQESQFLISELAFDGDMSKAADDHWLGSANLSLNHLGIHDASGTQLVIKDLRLDESVAEQNAQLLDVVFNLAAQQFALDEHNLSDANFHAELKNLDRTALQSYSKEVAQLEPDASADTAGMVLMASLMKNGPLLLRRSPQFNQELRFATPEGPFHGRLDIGFDGDGEFELAIPELLTRSRIAASFEAAKPLVTRFIQDNTREAVQRVALEAGETLTEAQVAVRADEIASARLAVLLGQGKLVENDDSYGSAALLDKGKFTLNGEDMGSPLALLLN